MAYSPESSGGTVKASGQQAMAAATPGHTRHVDRALRTDQYLQLCLCYPAAGKSCSFVIRQLETGLTKLGELLPWTAGADGALPIVMRMACRPTYGEITETNFPFRLITEQACSPVPPVNEDPLLVQINFIPEGLGLVFCGRCSVMDISRMGLVLNLLHELCIGAEIGAEQLAAAKSNYTLAELPDLGTPDLAEDAGEGAPLEGEWVYFSLDHLKLDGDLHDGAPSTPASEHTPDSATRLETLVAAFIFKAVVNAQHLSRGWSRDRRVVFAQNVRSRTYHDLPTECAESFAYTNLTVADAQTLSINEIADSLSEGGAKAAPSDLVFRSWLHLPAYDWSFGVGEPEAVRIPCPSPRPGLSFLLPRKHGESPVVGVCLSPNDLAALLAVPLFKEYAVYIG